MKTPVLVKKMNEEMRLRDLCSSTISNYEREVIEFFEYLQIGEANPTEDHIRQYLLHLRDKGVGHAKFKMALHGINFLFKKVLRVQWTIAPVAYPKRKKTLPVVLSQSEIRELLNATANLKARCVLSLMYTTGLRRREVSSLLISDVDSQRMQLFIRKSKGGKDRYVPVGQQTIGLLREYYKKYQPEKYLFNGYRKGTPLSAEALRHMLKQALSNTKIIKRVCLHTLRHSFATHLIEKGIPITTLQMLLGHATLISTLAYLKLVPYNLNRFPDLLQEVQS